MHQALILHVVLKVCETWFLRHREGHNLKQFQSKLTRRVFINKKYIITGDCRKLRSEERFTLRHVDGWVWWLGGTCNTHREIDACL